MSIVNKRWSVTFPASNHTTYDYHTGEETMGITVPKERLDFIDYLRGLAVLWMIEVHVIDVCLAQTLKHGWFYNIVNVSNGFVAVAFIFCAGIGFQLAFSKKESAYRAGDSSLWLYLRRLGHILLLAYWLHLPAFSLQRTLQSNGAEILSLFDCDVLQSIVYSSLIALTISLVVRSERIRMWSFFALAMFCYFGIGWVWSMYPLWNLPTFFSSLIAPQPISKFPLVPYAGHFFLGMVVIHVFRTSADLPARAKQMLIGALGIIAAVLILKNSPFDLPGHEDWWHYSAGHALYRSMVVVVVLMLFFLFIARVEKWRIAPMLLLCGRESLFMYISHLMLVYGTVSNFGLRSLAHNRWGVGETALVYVVVVALCYSLASLWHSVKKNDPKRATRLIATIVGAFAVVYCLIPSYLTQP
ncbi:MAG: heparan-alpha-glucosaminide N-acetyltransferase domain-containing protein [Candidatus Kapaibacterium sp.]